MFAAPTVITTFASSASSALNYINSTQNVSCLPPSPKTRAPRLRLKDFDATSKTGFMPSLSPVIRLPSQYEAWERALDLVNCGYDSVLSLGEDESSEALSKRVSSAAWRQRIEQMPVMTTRPMHSKPRLLQRAHHVLAFLAHFYIHSIPPSSRAPVLPASIAIPLVDVSRQLGMAPILTYADTVLWNVAPRDRTKPMAPGNLRILTTFSGTIDEEAFYECCANIEFHGADALSLMVSYQNEELGGLSRLRSDVLRSVSTGLDELIDIITDLTTILKTIHGSCSPKAFYDLIRPWFRGSSSGPAAWVFEGISADQWDSDWDDLSGPSGGQSTLMHALDLFLDIDHSLDKSNDMRTRVSERPGNDRSFLRRMQKYMPATQRAFLERLAASKMTPRQLSVSLARSQQSNGPTPALASAIISQYNEAVIAMRHFRDSHLKIAAIYIVAQARQAANESLAPPPSACPVGAMLAKLAADGDADLLAVCPMSGLNVKGEKPAPAPASSGPVLGTGGTELMCLLRSCRDATTRALIPASQ